MLLRPTNVINGSIYTFENGDIVLCNGSAAIALLKEEQATLKYLLQNPAIGRGVHTNECMTSTLNTLKEAEEWRIKWPNHCPICKGAGAFYHSGSREEPPSIDLCSCTEQGICPRCGGTLVSEPCPSCNWNYNDKMPELDGRDCWTKGGYYD